MEPIGRKLGRSGAKDSTAPTTAPAKHIAMIRHLACRIADSTYVITIVYLAPASI